ncbi:Prenylcysteine lyase-domain-containing protein [Chytriomyces sp. MP71]|nr:Prenylcysteine lyase-domain-containing protein [Chytriomyces sp. MP71]
MHCRRLIRLLVLASTLLASVAQALASSQQTHGRRVAVIGGGAGGVSAALFTHNLAGNYTTRPVQLTLFEASERIGGRARAVAVPNPFDPTLDPVLVETGAAMFVSLNTHLMAAVKRYNLSLVSQSESCSTKFEDPNESRRKHDVEPQAPAFGIFNGQDIIFSADEDSTWSTIAKAAWRWGLLSPYRARSLALSTAAQFAKSYELEANNGLGFANLRSFLMDGLRMDLALVTSSAREYLLSQGVGAQFLDEFVEPATRVNYGQNLDCNALGALICLTAAFVDGDAVVGGNSLIFEGMVKESGAKVLLETPVEEVRKTNASTYSLLDASGKLLGEFDDVIVAVPFVEGLPCIRFTNTQTVPTPIPYVHLHVTFVTGVLNPSRFHTGPGQLPRAILTTAAAAVSGLPVNSIGTRHEFPGTNVTVTKLFSQHTLGDVALSALYETVLRVERLQWDAYPVLRPLSWEDSGDPVVVVDEIVGAGGVFHVNAFEAYFSAMEGETVASANVVQLMMGRWRELEEKEALELGREL